MIAGLAPKASGPALLSQAPGAVAALGLGIAIVLSTMGTPLPGLLLALVAGMVLRQGVQRLSPLAALAPGLEQAAKPLLRTGVALMGFKIALSDIAGLGWTPVVTAMVATGGTLVGGYGLARLVGLGRTAAILTASAVAICGAAAALAMGAVLARRDPDGTRASLVATVAAITVIGFACAFAWPVMAEALGWSGPVTAILVGASIHEVAQVVAAGDLLTPADAATATLVKMVRVAMMPVLVVGLGVLEARVARAQGDPGEGTSLPVPLFLLGFVAAIALANSGALPHSVVHGAATASGLLLAGAMVAIGSQTSARGILSLGSRPLVALLGQTLLIAALVVACLAVSGLL